jgi:hypothetical protein
MARGVNHTVVVGLAALTAFLLDVISRDYAANGYEIVLIDCISTVGQLRATGRDSLWREVGEIITTNADPA